MLPRKGIFRAATAFALLGLAFFLLLPTHPLIPSVRATNRTISLYGNYPYWNTSNPTIPVNQGDVVTINLSSQDGAPHRFLLDIDGDGVTDIADCSPTMDPCSPQFTVPTTITFTASSVGNYKYYCTVHYPSMTGNFVVQAPPTPDFSVTSNPTSLTILQGASSTSTITLTSTNGFSGTVSLTRTISPSGPAVSFSPTSVPLSSGSGTSTMTVSAAGGAYSSVATGNYSVNVTATSGSLSHSMIVAVTVSSTTSQPPGTPGLPVALVVGAAVAIIVVIGVVVYLVRRKPAAT